MAERVINFEAVLDDSGNLSVARSKADDFSALEMLGILEVIKADVIKDIFPKPKRDG